MVPQSPPRSNQNQNQATHGCTSPPSAFFFSAPMAADDDGDSGSVTPRLRHSGSFAYVPNSPYHHPMSSPAKEMETGTQELMKLHEDKPKFTNELSFKYLVVHNADTGEMNSDDSPASQETDNNLKIKGASGGHIRRKNNGPMSFLLNMIVSSGLMVRSHSSGPSKVVRKNDNQSSGISSKNVVRREPNRLLSLLRIRRIRASKTFDITPSTRASKVSPRPYLGKDGQPDLPLMGSPNGPKSNNSNQCAMCSAYTVFFKTQCQACDKIYCISCVKLAIVDTQKGPRCQATCAFGSNRERDLEPKTNRCWPSLSTIKIKAGSEIHYSFSKEEEREHV